jgi:HK97 gp10 family phage protein
MARQAVKLEGLNETLAGLATLPKATGKNVLKRAGLAAIGKFIDAAESRAPKMTGQLSRNVEASTRLNRAARGLPGGKMSVVINAGPVTGRNNVVGSKQEHGTRYETADPFMRPAFDETAQPILDELAGAIWAEIDVAAKRLAAKAARLAKKRGR